MAASPQIAISERPTRQRYWVVVLGVALAFITYIDRACIGQAAPAISRELHLTPLQMGYVFSIFGFTYAAFEVPSGWLGDWIGPRKVLMRIVLAWSVFTAATGWAWNLPSLLVTRFLFAIGESGCFPNLAKCFSVWLPVRERGIAEGMKAASARWGGAVTPLLVVGLMNHFTWRGTFQIFALFGVVWAIVFYRWYRDDPRDRAGVNASELALLHGAASRAAGNAGVPWKKFLSSRSAWLLWTQWFCYNYGFYFYLTWLPTYLQQARGIELRKSALLAGLPLLCAGSGSLVSGLIALRLSKIIGDVSLTRKITACTGFGASAIMLLVFARLHDPVLAIAALCVSSFAAEFSGPLAWTTCMDLGGRYVGSLTGGMNTLGQLGGGVGPAMLGMILTWFHNDWSIAFYVSAAVSSLGIVCWLLMDPVTSLDT